MEDEGGLGGDGDLASLDGCEALLVALDVAADDGVGAVGDLNGAGALMGVESHVDVAPLLTWYTTAIDVIGHEAVLGGQKVQIAAHQVGTAHVESGMGFAHGNQVLVVFHHLGIAFQIVPVQMVDVVGTLVAVVHTFLVAQHLLAAEHERHTL